MSWPEFSLDELGTVSRGRSRHRPRDAAFLYGGKYPFIQTGDVKRSPLYLTDYSQTYSEAGLAQSKLWPAGTLCITIAANIAETAILDIDACFPDSIIGFLADHEKADTKFIKYQFDALLKKRMKKVSHGAAQDNLSQAKLLSFNFPVPDLSLQKRISSILSSYDDLIENNRRRIFLLEQSAQLLYREWFVHLRFPGHETTEIVDGVPEGWTRTPLSQLAKIVMGQSPKSKFYNDVGDGLPFHQGVTNYGFRFLNDVTYSTKATKIAEPNDIMFSVRAPVGRINITLNKIIVGRGLAALRSKTDHQSFLFYQLKNHFFKEDLIGGGAIYAATNKKELEKIELTQPNFDLLTRFERISVPIDAQIETLTKEISFLTQARDLLLPRLMDGSIKV